MHDFALVGQKCCLYQLFLRIKPEKLCFLIDQRFKECIKIARIKLRSRSGNPARHIEMADDLHAIHFSDLASNSTFNIAAAFHCQINQHRTRTHCRNHLFGHKTRSRTARNKCGRNDNILLGNMISNEYRLLRLIFLRHFLGITARGFRRLEFLILDSDELRAKRGNLLFCGRPNVGRRYNRTQAARGRNRLKSGNACPHDEDARRWNSASCRHHHRHCTIISFRRINHCLISCKIGLR